MKKLIFLIIILIGFGVAHSASAADRYWVGGTGTWNSSATTHWSTSSGGSAGASVPTASDNVYFNGSSGGGTVTVSTSNTPCLTLDFTGYTGTWAGSSSMSISGSLILATGMARTYTGTITFNSTTGPNLITSNGKTLASNLTFNGVGGSWQLTDDLSDSGKTMNLTNGSFNANNFNLTLGSFQSSNTNIRTLTMGSGTWTIDGAANTSWYISIVGYANLVLDSGTSTIKFTNTSATNRSFQGGVGFTYYNFWSSAGASTATLNFLGGNTFNEIRDDGTAAHTIAFQASYIQTVNSLVLNATAGNVVSLQSSSSGSPWFITDLSGTNSYDYLSITDSYVFGGATWTAGTHSTFVARNVGWSDLTNTNRYWVPGGDGNWSSTSNWSLTDGGASGASSPTIESNVYFTSNSGNGTSLMDSNMTIMDLDFTGFTGTFSGSSTLSVWGDLILSSNMNYSHTGYFYFSGIGNKTITSNNKTITNLAVILSGLSISPSTYTLQDDLNISNSLYVQNYSTFNTNNYNINSSGFMVYNNNSNTVNMGSSTLTVNDFNFNVFDPPTQITYNPGTSTIKMVKSLSGLDRSFSGSGLTYYNLWFTGTGSGTFILYGSNIFNQLKIDTVGVPVTFEANKTQTVSSIDINGSEGNLITMQSNSNGVPWTISKASGSVVVNYVSLKDSVATGGATFTAYNSTDVSGNSGWVFINKPTLATSAVSGTTDTSTTLNGEITNVGGEDVTVRGFQYGATNSYGSTINENGNYSTGTFSLDVSSLACNTVYYYRSYATNTAGTGYGSEQTFTTGPCVGTTNTAPAINITQTSSTLVGEITDTGGEDASERGFNYGIDENNLDINVSENGFYTVEEFTQNISSLVCNTVYYFQAYSINTTATSYGSVVSFTTLPCSPEISNIVASDITKTTAILSAEVIDTGGGNLSIRGFEYGTDSGIYTGSNYEEGDYGIGQYSIDLSSLTCDTLYYYRAYATNSGGSGYSAEDTLNTSSCVVLSTMLTREPSNINTTKVELSGTISSNGGEDPSSYGFNWGKTVDYENSDIVINTPISSGDYSYNLSELKCNTLYHYRAFATNSEGTSYGDDVSFETKNCPISIGYDPSFKINNPLLNFNQNSQSKYTNLAQSILTIPVTIKKGCPIEYAKPFQEALNIILKTNLVIDGRVGPKTIEAIKKFQKDNNLVVDGIAGKMTKKKISELLLAI